jgi:hypothetical protein
MLSSSPLKMHFELSPGPSICSFSVEWVAANAATIEFCYGAGICCLGENIGIRFVGTRNDSLVTMNFDADSRLFTGLDIFIASEYHLHPFDFTFMRENGTVTLRLEPNSALRIQEDFPSIYDVKQDIELHIWKDALSLNVAGARIRRHAIGSGIYAGFQENGQFGGLDFTDLEQSHIMRWEEVVIRKGTDPRAKQ